MRRRHLGAALLAVVIAGQFAARPASATHAPPVLVGVRDAAYVDGPKKVCANVATTFEATISTFFDFDDGHTRYTSNMGKQQGFLDVSAAGSTTRVATTPNAVTTVQFTFPNTGTYRVTAFGARTTAGAFDPVYPASTDVEVESCNYKIQQMSIWFHLAEGFKPWVGGLVDPVTFRLEPGKGPGHATKSLRTFAIGKFDCPISFDVDDVNATILAELTAPDNLHYYIAYSDGTAKVSVACPSPIGPIGATSREGPFKLDLIEGDVPVGPICVLTCIWTYTGPVVSRRFPHVLHQQSDANGVTHVIIEQVQ